MYFEIYQDIQGKYRWHLKAANHEIIAQGQGYTTRQNCQHAIDLVRSTSNDTPIK